MSLKKSSFRKRQQRVVLSLLFNVTFSPWCKAVHLPALFQCHGVNSVKCQVSIFSTHYNTFRPTAAQDYRTIHSVPLPKQLARDNGLAGLRRWLERLLATLPVSHLPGVGHIAADDCSGRGEARDWWEAGPSVLIGFIMGMLNYRENHTT